MTSMKVAEVSVVPQPVLDAFAHVRQFHPEVTHVYYNREGMWVFMDDDFDAPVFDTRIDYEVLRAAQESVTCLPCAFAIPSKDVEW